MCQQMPPIYLVPSLWGGDGGRDLHHNHLNIGTPRRATATIVLPFKKWLRTSRESTREKGGNGQENLLFFRFCSIFLNFFSLSLPIRDAAKNKYWIPTIIHRGDELPTKAVGRFWIWILNSYVESTTHSGGLESHERNHYVPLRFYAKTEQTERQSKHQQTAARYCLLLLFIAIRSHNRAIIIAISLAASTISIV